VIGMQRGAAEAAIRQAGLVASVSFSEACDRDDPSCDYRPGAVWSQSLDGDAQREQGSTVTIFVNP
jgi:beta-lactam-binding protein with PASTA domain